MIINIKEETIELAIANIAATSAMLEKISNSDNRRLSPYAAGLLEQMSWELHKLAGDLQEINYNYVS